MLGWFKRQSRKKAEGFAALEESTARKLESAAKIMDRRTGAERREEERRAPRMTMMHDTQLKVQ